MLAGLLGAIIERFGLYRPTLSVVIISPTVVL